MLEVEIKSKKSTLYELEVKAIMSQLGYYSETLDGAERVFNHDIKNLPRKSVGEVSDFYKMTLNGNTLEVWHLNIQGEKDRLVGTVKEIK